MDVKELPFSDVAQKQNKTGMCFCYFSHALSLLVVVVFLFVCFVLFVVVVFLLLLLFCFVVVLFFHGLANSTKILGY